MPMISSSFPKVSNGDQALVVTIPCRAMRERQWARWACQIAMMPMKTMIAEKIMLLMVPGSHGFEALLSCGMFGVVAGSLGGAIMPVTRAQQGS